MKRMRLCARVVALFAVAMVFSLAPAYAHAAAQAEQAAGSFTRTVAIADKHFSGNGGQSVNLTLAKGLAVFDSAVTGTETNFVVWLRRSDGSNIELIANSIGDYSGSVAAQVPVTGNYRLDIQSDADWQVTARQPRATTAPKTRSWSGDGERVTSLFHLSAGTYRFSGSHQGQSSYIVHLVDLNGTTVEYLANKTGAGSASKLFTVNKSGVYVLSVDADGPWTVSLAARTIAYKFSRFTVPRRGHPGRWFTISVRINPTYIGPSSRPVTMYAQKKSGKRWVKTMKASLSGTDRSTYTNYAARVSVSEGTWRMWAVFDDANHRRTKTAYRKVRVK